jgi:hypothetical protein
VGTPWASNRNSTPVPWQTSGGRDCAAPQRLNPPGREPLPLARRAIHPDGTTASTPEHVRCSRVAKLPIYGAIDTSTKRDATAIVVTTFERATNNVRPRVAYRILSAARVIRSPSTAPWKTVLDLRTAFS